MKKTMKKAFSMFLVLAMVLGVFMPQVTDVAYGADLLAQDLKYEHAFGQENKTITEADGTKHDVFCVNPNIQAQSTVGNDSDKRDKWTADAIVNALNFNTSAGSSRMRGTQEDQDVLASIIIYGREQGKSYKEIQDAVADAVQNAAGARPYNSLVDYAYANKLDPSEYELYVYGHKSKPSEYQTVIDAVRKAPPKKVQVRFGKDKVLQDEDGNAVEQTEGQFSFRITGNNNETEGYDKTVSTTKNADGTFTAWSETFTFTREGYWEYNVAEIDGGEENITYDTTVQAIGINVAWKDGELVAQIWGQDVATSAGEPAEKKIGTVTNTIKKEEKPEEKEGKLGTTVSVDEKSASADAALEIEAPAGETSVTKTVVDCVDYADLVKGATYVVQGTLVEVENGKVVKVIAKSEPAELKAEEENGTWEITFENVTLEVGKTYVVFEEATMTKNEEGKEVPEEERKPIEHKNPEDKAQTIVVNETPEEPKEEEPPKENEPKENEPPTEEPEEPKENTPPPQVPSTGQKEPPKNETPPTPPTTPQNPPQTPPQVPSTGNPPAAPNTGDTNNIMLWVLLGAAAAFVATLSLRIRIKR